MREKILEILGNEETKTLKIEELYDKLNLSSTEDFTNLKTTLDKMVYEKVLYLSKRDKYLLISNSHFIQGKMCMNAKGFGFVSAEGYDKDIFIPATNINNARHDDVVLVELTDKKKNEGRIIKVVKRDNHDIVGEFYVENGKNYVHPDKKGFSDIEIPSDKTKGAVPGHKVVVKPFENDSYKGEITTIIGHKNDVGVDIESFIYNNNFKPNFPPEVMASLDSIPEVVNEEEIRGRLDLRNNTIFTIDGDDTKDIDDAISVTKNEDGTYELGVHIADVTHYVKEDSVLDKEAYIRSTSVYVVDRVVPMLPHKLSNGICSLNPEVDRLSMSCIMKFNKEGSLIDYKIGRSVINSKKQMTYNNVNKILEENIIPEGYEQFEKDLRLAKELSDILRKKMVDRGYQEFSSAEPKFIVDENCHPLDIKIRRQGVGENLIENFMIAANETTVGCLMKLNLPSIFRVHDKPNIEKLRTFFSLLSKKGIVVTGKKETITAKTLQDIIKQLSTRPDALIYNSFAVRTQAKAVYSPENIGHFGLGSTGYSHFTSPIRRYPDDILHREIKDYLRLYNLDFFTKSNVNDILSHNDLGNDASIVRKWEKVLPELCEHVSEKEQDAVNCERDVDKMKKAEYMEDYIGKTFEGVISGVTEFGLFIQLPNTVEGLVKEENIVGDNYYYKAKQQALVGKKTKRELTFGDAVTVKTIGASKANSTVDFEIIAIPKELNRDEEKVKTKIKKR